jgi:hypothetical protein
MLAKRGREAFYSVSSSETQLVLRESHQVLPVNPVNILLRAGGETNARQSRWRAMKGLENASSRPPGITFSHSSGIELSLSLVRVLV